MKVTVEVPDDLGSRDRLAGTILSASDDAHRAGKRDLADALAEVGKAIKRPRHLAVVRKRLAGRSE